jgi:hypothetical protein
MVEREPCINSFLVGLSYSRIESEKQTSIGSSRIDHSNCDSHVPEIFESAIIRSAGVRMQPLTVLPVHQ